MYLRLKVLYAHIVLGFHYLNLNIINDDIKIRSRPMRFDLNEIVHSEYLQMTTTIVNMIII